MEFVIPVLMVLSASLAIVITSRPVAAISVCSTYILAGMLLASGVGLPVAATYAITGVAAGTILLLSGPLRSTPRQASAPEPGRAAISSEPRPSTAAAPSLGWFFMVMTLTFCVIVAYGLATTYPLSEAVSNSEWVNFVAYWLLIAGALAASITRSPLRSGQGLLLLLCGASLTYVLLTESYRPANTIGLLLLAFPITLVISRLGTERIGRLTQNTQSK